jgi:ABC-type multidrug transport system ATPase subunit
VDKVIGILELESYSNRLVGSLEENYGLSFEQRKRLSIAVELAASPSILFLDEVKSRYLDCVSNAPTNISQPIVNFFQSSQHQD